MISEFQKPRMASERIVSSLALVASKATCSEVYRSLLKKLISTLIRTEIITENSSTPSQIHTLIDDRPLK